MDDRNRFRFDTSSIPQNGYPNNNQLGRGLQEQQKYIQNYNAYQPSSTFVRSDNTNTANLENLRDFSQFNVEQAFKQNSVIEHMPDNKYLHNTLYDNLNENLNKETIQEVRLNIDSMDRDIQLYPDPFKYIVTFGPVVNSGVTSTIERANLKNDVRKLNKMKYPNSRKKAAQEDLDEDFDISQVNPNILVNYDNHLKRIYNPYITQSFVNVKFIRLDNVVLPRFNKVIINTSWNYCTVCYGICENCTSSSTTTPNLTIKDDYERVKTDMIKNNRYIPDDNHLGPLFTDRYVLVGIKEIENNQNLATNQKNSRAFAIFPDKYMGLLYWRGSPYYAVKIYKDSLLGNINRLSFEFFDSWGAPIILNRVCVDYETTQLIETDFINPDYINIHEIIADTNLTNFFINKITEIIKCFVMINFNITNRIFFFE
ncbi:MAG: hypothetical protein Gaeavirus16_2 [Gaeavirus sp.]|uniref:Uncharacterized protein n=1 Tax=Gaeavirus sp. TaxID=2487767 RepID=A0A3G4ZZ25_9VIRU|nr:MAG: hypothetical protein Gaeavirus16_2 [Gaeavirus sp.]